MALKPSAAFLDFIVAIANNELDTKYYPCHIKYTYSPLEHLYDLGKNNSQILFAIHGLFKDICKNNFSVINQVVLLYNYNNYIIYIEYL